MYAISKNEEQFVDRWMDAVSEADLVVVTDTGSTDSTVEKLRARGAVVWEETIEPWRFDAARNIAMDHLPHDADICVSNDLDEVFETGWRRKLEEAWRPEHTRARYWFVWSHRPDGKPEQRFAMEKIHRRWGFRWVHPVHEVLEYTGEDPDSPVLIDDLVLHHRPDPHKSRGQYLPLLELSAKENPQDDRTAFWLGREYVLQGHNDKGIEALTRHLKLPGATWDEERSASMRFIARALSAKGDTASARDWLLKAAAECPSVREPWVDLARLGYAQKDWPLVLFAVEKGLAIRRRGDSYLTEPASWGEALFDFGAIACYWLGLYPKALSLAEEACALSPGEERLTRNRALILEKLRGGAAE